MKKRLMLVAASLAMLGSLASCGAKTVTLETYNAQSCYIEEAYRGDCWDGVTETLVLDGTNYIRIEDTSVIQQSGVVVAYWTYTMKGTYSVVSEDKENNKKTVKLAKATSVDKVMMGALTTSADDATLLDYTKAQEMEVTLDLTAYQFSTVA